MKTDDKNFGVVELEDDMLENVAGGRATTRGSRIMVIEEEVCNKLNDVVESGVD